MGRARRPQYFVIGVGIAVILLTCVYLYVPFGKRSIRLKRDPMKRIVLFTTQWWQPEFPYLKEANEFCPKCIFTQDHSAWDISDAVIFHGRMLDSRIPKRWNSSQLWVFMHFETTALNIKAEKDLYVLMKSYDGLFNWTMTYRRDSDVFVPYGKFIPIRKHPRPKFSQVWAFIPGAKQTETYTDLQYVATPSLNGFGTRKTGAWITSRCNSPSLREVKISQLSKYLDIDIYGDCGPLKCDIPKPEALSGVDCRMQIQKKYKFYFAFENSICEDYVTEKFFDTTLTQMIPVVYGGADYRAMFPPNSFINLMDFNSTKELAEYLIYLSGHPSEWLKYFDWRKEFWVQTNRFVTGYCDLCDKLWTTDIQTVKTYPSVADWWIYGSSFNTTGLKPVCAIPNDERLKGNLSSTLI